METKFKKQELFTGTSYTKETENEVVIVFDLEYKPSISVCFNAISNNGVIITEDEFNTAFDKVYLKLKEYGKSS